MEMEKGAIRKFARAVGVSNPLYFDEAYARARGFRSVVVPEDMLFGIEFTYTPAPVECPAPTVLDGGGEWEFLRPIVAGDIITFERRLVDVSERRTSMGKTYFVTTEIVWSNQHREVVAKGKLTDICY